MAGDVGVQGAPQGCAVYGVHNGMLLMGASWFPSSGDDARSRKQCFRLMGGLGMGVFQEA